MADSKVLAPRAVVEGVPGMPTPQLGPPPEPPSAATPPPWSGTARTARTRILASYAVLLVLAGVLSTLATRSVLLVHLERRIDAALSQEVLEANRLFVDGRDPMTGAAFTSLEPAFDVYFRRNVPSPEEALLAFVDGQLYRSALARFPLDQVPTELIETYGVKADDTNVAESSSGHTPSPLGTVHHRALPVQIGSSTGTFVVAILPVEELAEIRRLQLYSAAGVVAALLVAAACAWWVVGRTLHPVRLLTQTARAITQSNLNQRVPVYGDEGADAAETARTFNAMLDRLEAALTHEREFIRNASHELRVPLTICLGNLALIEEGMLDERPHERAMTVAMLGDELERMGRTVEDLRLLADADSPHFLRVELLDLAELTQDLVTKARSLAPREWTIDAVAHGLVPGDAHRLTEAVLNLAHNAIQHTSETDTLAIGTALGETTALIWVRDTGCGVGPHDHARIFEPLHRGQGAFRRYRGSGLGLAIVKKIAELHGGRVTLESEPEAGATFTIILPLAAREGAA